MSEICKEGPFLGDMSNKDAEVGLRKYLGLEQISADKKKKGKEKL